MATQAGRTFLSKALPSQAPTEDSTSAPPLRRNILDAVKGLFRRTGTAHPPPPLTTPSPTVTAHTCVVDGATEVTDLNQLLEELLPVIIPVAKAPFTPRPITTLEIARRAILLAVGQGHRIRVPEPEPWTEPAPRRSARAVRPGTVLVPLNDEHDGALPTRPAPPRPRRAATPRFVRRNAPADSAVEPLLPSSVSQEATGPAHVGPYPICSLGSAGTGAEQITPDAKSTSPSLSNSGSSSPSTAHTSSDSMEYTQGKAKESDFAKHAFYLEMDIGMCFLDDILGVVEAKLGRFEFPPAERLE
ncbi:hypothetical protein HDU93_008261 [Gonapodya sp. JEL0774]|nr:hypothetical protein HDU93_008261 [Gonapodya sp. JEL0774]